MYDETEGSSVSGESSYEEQDEMEHFINRCSICFDAELDLCLESCRDQYCLQCFQRYIDEVVKSSWGLSVTPIRCPVCNDIIPKHEWSQHVSRSTYEMYEKFNQPYRSFKRCCPDCENELVPCQWTDTTFSTSNNNNNIFHLCNMMDIMLHTHSSTKTTTTAITSTTTTHKRMMAVQKWSSVYKRQQDWSDKELLSNYKRMMLDIISFEQTFSCDNTFACAISLQFIHGLCTKPDIWKQIQFSHIGFFPNMSCKHCDINVCLHCGYKAHVTTDCETNMKTLSHDKTIDKESRKTVKWKLKNSRRCPSCSVMINRDEGCNKVDCSYCGFSFCWACQSSWADGCGFYRCSNTTSHQEYHSNNNSLNSSQLSENNTSMFESDNTTISTTTAALEEKTELGVPNMKNIQARITSYRSMNNEVIAATVTTAATTSTVNNMDMD